ncbi:alpha-1,2-fucosyltransferase [Curtobacterium sp. C1]|uniref:alpha-1,2-fucosyltransferase n=1 Tax=Curtobacterium sp. C1 TaxID=2898151 RepID=UPI001E555FA4|nr:alpha-1,2-fucosyltransferase [Curtobacterium sp. C1]UFU14572.1 alpha-1,2-fucosyltransferase [Curtobacterium sp. C1]
MPRNKRLDESAVLWVQGGLGNQLFQLSAAFQTAQQKSLSLLLSRSSFGRDKLRNFELERLINPTKILTSAEEHRLGQPYNWRGKRRTSPLLSNVRFQFASDHPQESDFEPGTLNIGFYQEHAWLELPTDIVRGELTHQASAVKGMLREGQLVAHVRRGDYATSASARASFGFLDRDYYHRAASELGRELQEAIIFTDDVQAVQREFGVSRDQVVGSDDIRSPLDTLLTMSTASALIIPNSTFSWWAAEIAGDVPVAAPETWFFDRPEDLKRQQWIAVPNSS